MDDRKLKIAAINKEIESWEEEVKKIDKKVNHYFGDIVSAGNCLYPPNHYDFLKQEAKNRIKDLEIELLDLTKNKDDSHFENLFLEVPTNFVPLKPIYLTFDVKPENILEIVLDYDLTKKGLMILGYCPLNDSQIEMSVINLNALELIVGGINASVSYQKHQDKSSFNGLWQNSIKTKNGQLFAKIKFKD